MIVNSEYIDRYTISAKKEGGHVRRIDMAMTMVGIALFAVVVADATVRPADGKQESAEPVQVETQTVEEWHDAGRCKITHYCACSRCCGKCDGITKTGTVAEMGRTVAVDPEVIPLGSTVRVNGVCYVAEDTGVRGAAVDIYIDDHAQATAMGTYMTVVKWR